MKILLFLFSIMFLTYEVQANLPLTEEMERTQSSETVQPTGKNFLSEYSTLPTEQYGGHKTVWETIKSIFS